MQGRGSKPEAPPEEFRRIAGRPSCRGVDRNHREQARDRAAYRRPSCRGVDRNLPCGSPRSTFSCRPPCRGVDRNIYSYAVIARASRVAPHAGAWFETPRVSEKMGIPSIRAKMLEYV